MFQTGDIIVGLPSADFEYKFCNSKLLRVEIIDNPESMLISIEDSLAHDSWYNSWVEQKMERTKFRKLFRVNPAFFRLATNKEKAEALLRRL